MQRVLRRKQWLTLRLNLLGKLCGWAGDWTHPAPLVLTRPCMVKNQEISPTCLGYIVFFLVAKSFKTSKNILLSNIRIWRIKFVFFSLIELFNYSGYSFGSRSFCKCPTEQWWDRFNEGKCLTWLLIPSMTQMCMLGSPTAGAWGFDGEQDNLWTCTW